MTLRTKITIATNNTRTILSLDLQIRYECLIEWLKVMSAQVNLVLAVGSTLRNVMPNNTALK